MNEHSYNPTCECLSCVTWDRARLRMLLDKRPALNAGLETAYETWTRGVYLSDFKAVTGVVDN